MRKLIVQTFVTLDGVMQAQADPGRTTAAGSPTAAGPCELLGRADGPVAGRSGEHAVRHGARPQDLRHHGRLLAAAGKRKRADVQQRHQVRRLAGVGPRWSGATRS